jgi:hypothetical protein
MTQFLSHLLGEKKLQWAKSNSRIGALETIHWTRIHQWNQGFDGRSK